MSTMGAYHEDMDTSEDVQYNRWIPRLVLGDLLTSLGDVQHKVGLLRVRWGGTP